ncbi:MAG: c-type cytochrome [Verrucomicrobiales bacterium]|nr:c-type cytochrome [Verrucomicrobiales bacterium]
MKKVLSAVCIALLFSCGVGILKAEEKSGFRFPGGDSEKGSEVFVGLNCVQCHSVKGVHLEDSAERRLDLVLAEEPRFVKKYEDIMTAISNPKHVVIKQYESLMTKAELEGLSAFMEDFTGRMTLRQFMDLVAFLDKAYSQSAEFYGAK